MTTWPSMKVRGNARLWEDHQRPISSLSVNAAPVKAVHLLKSAAMQNVAVRSPRTCWKPMQNFYARLLDAHVDIVNVKACSAAATSRLTFGFTAGIYDAQ